MKKTELVNLIKEELNYIKKNQNFDNLEEATENIATDIFTANDWESPNAFESLRETLDSMTVVDDTEEDFLHWFGFKLYKDFGNDLENLEEYTADDVNLENLLTDIKSIREKTIYMNNYKEYWTEF